MSVQQISPTQPDILARVSSPTTAPNQHAHEPPPPLNRRKQPLPPPSPAPPLRPPPPHALDAGATCPRPALTAAPPSRSRGCQRGSGGAAPPRVPGAPAPSQRCPPLLRTWLCGALAPRPRMRGRAPNMDEEARDEGASDECGETRGRVPEDLG